MSFKSKHYVISTTFPGVDYENTWCNLVNIYDLSKREIKMKLQKDPNFLKVLINCVDETLEGVEDES
ncbi:MAG TPA: hypothetical protein VMX17_03410 [Candidatus Glassbacteria bacterium]|nr:hypothetical protein [Candidatus Glassbacteria bacterium]